jgi:hypothetical protein
MQRNPKVRVVVFDPDVDVVQKLRRQLTLRIPHFDSKRVIRVSGDCAATLPDFLDGKLRDTSVEAGKSARAKRRTERATETSNSRRSGGFGRKAVRHKPREQVGTRLCGGRGEVGRIGSKQDDVRGWSRARFSHSATTMRGESPPEDVQRWPEGSSPGARRRCRDRQRSVRTCPA